MYPLITEVSSNKQFFYFSNFSSDFLEKIFDDFFTLDDSDLVSDLVSKWQGYPIFLEIRHNPPKYPDSVSLMTS